jgi:predicted PurR-regulated permease PerM
MNDPVHESESSEPPVPLEGSVRLWFITSVIGLFILALFYTLKVAADLFLPIVLASFLGFLLTPVTRWLRKIGLPNFWSPLIGTLGFFCALP